MQPLLLEKRTAKLCLFVASRRARGDNCVDVHLCAYIQYCTRAQVSVTVSSAKVTKKLSVRFPFFSRYSYTVQLQLGVPTATFTILYFIQLLCSLTNCILYF